MKKKTPTLEFFLPGLDTPCELPLVTARVSAGFPSPADDSIDKKLDLNSFLIRRPASTFFVRAVGESMLDAGIHPGDILIVDKSLEATDNKVVIAVVNGEFTVKRIKRIEGKLCLLPDNPAFKPIPLDENDDFAVWGVVTAVVHQL